MKFGYWCPTPKGVALEMMKKLEAMASERGLKLRIIGVRGPDATEIAGLSASIRPQLGLPHHTTQPEAGRSYEHSSDRA